MGDQHQDLTAQLVVNLLDEDQLDVQLQRVEEGEYSAANEEADLELIEESREGKISYLVFKNI
jgi:hypothetical protein